MKYLKLTLVLALGLSLLAGLFPFTAWATGLLTNGGFNNPFNDIIDRNQWHSQYEKIANGWQPFYIAANTEPGSGNASKLHWMSSAQFVSSGLGKIDYHQEGDQAQMIWSSYKFDAGVYQQVSGLTSGQVYKFDIDMVTYWRGPGYADTNGKMVKQVGIDPYGGTNPASPDIIWSATDADDKNWIGMVAAATAESSTITVFAKVQAPENDSSNHTDLDMVYFENARLQDIGSGAITTLNGDTSGATINLTWTASGGWSFTGYEVQYKDLSGGEWVTLQDKSSTNTVGSFTGQVAHTYLIRARTWQTVIGLNIPGRWSEISITVKDIIAGRVTDHAGLGLNDVTVVVSGASTSTISANGGAYVLATGSGIFTVTASDMGDFVAPPAATVIVPTGGVGVLTITLRPDGGHQVITNNDLETGLAGWHVSDPSTASISATAHTGNSSLWLFNTVSVSQTGVVSGMARPLLSFWYKNDTLFTVELLIEDSGGQTAALGVAQSRLLEPVSDWTYFTLDSSGVYTGGVGVNFSYPGGAGANILIDEVSLAAGPELIPTYLPLVIKDN